MKKSKAFSIHDIVMVGLFAAMIFVSTMFLSIRIPTPVGTTMLKTANAICLIGALLMGPLKGGLAAGIGSALFDLFNPEYASGAWLTFILFFVMAFICGLISHSGNSCGRKNSLNFIACLGGALSYTAMYVIKSILTLMIAGSVFSAAFTAVIPKMITSLINAAFAVTVASLFTPVLRKSLERSGIIK